MPVVTDREYRKFEIANLELRQLDDGQMVVEGYATTFDQPYELWRDKYYVVMEKVDRHAFDNTDMSDTIMQYNHEGPVYARVSNNTLEITIDEHGLKIRAYLGGTERGRQLFEEIKGGYITKMSIGFTVRLEKREEIEDGETGFITLIRTLADIGKLFDVSAVSIPANDATEISARSIGDGVIAEALKERQANEERQRRKKMIRLMIEMGGHSNDD